MPARWLEAAWLVLLVAQKVADRARVCIVGASYGGYAALAGATFTPNLYKCAVSISGLGDLADFLKSRRKKFGADSDIYAYWIKQIGDPERDAARIAAASPQLHVDQIKAPILLVHGDADQSGRPTPLITLENEDHSDWSEENEQLVMKALGEFVESKIGPGFGLNLENHQ